MRKLIVGGLILASLTSPLLAAPEGGTVTAGSATIDGTTIRQHTEKAIIDWLRFNVGVGERVRFLQPSRSSVALNRVVGSDPSLILGQLQANGQIFLVNPNGILFGPGSQVDAGGLLATTLSITNDDFLSGHYSFAQDPACALSSVVNQGNLVGGDYVVLTAPLVSNEGAIAARVVRLGAGGAMRVSFDGLVRYELGSVVGQGDAVELVSVSDVLRGAVQQGGLMTAGELTGDRLAGGNGVLVQAGTITGTDVRLDSTSVTAVQAASCVEAQTITVFSTGNTLMQGTLAADGFVETSGMQNILLGGSVTAGELLIDPPTITIVSGTAGSNQVSADQFINPTLNAGTSVTISTNTGGAGSGDIVQNAGATISKTSGAATTLTLDAVGGITLNDSILAGTPLSVVLTAGSGTFLTAGEQIATGGASLTSSGSGTFQSQGGTLDSGGGTIDLTYAGGFTLGDVTSVGGNVLLTSSSAGVVQSAGATTAGSLFLSTAGADTLDFGNQVAALSTSGTNAGALQLANDANLSLGPIATNGGSIQISTTGDLTFTDQVAGGLVNLSATGVIGTTGGGTDITATGSVQLNSATGIGASGLPIQISQPAGATQFLVVSGDGGGMFVQNANDLTNFNVQANGGQVDVSGPDTLTLNGNILNAAVNAGTNLTFSNSGSPIVLDDVDATGGTVSIASTAAITDDSNDLTRVRGLSVMLSGLGVGALTNLVDVESNSLNVQATGADVGVDLFTASPTVTVSAAINAKVRNQTGNINVADLTATTAALSAGGTISDVPNDMAAVLATSLFVTATGAVTLEVDAANVTAASTGSNLGIENRRNGKTAATLSAPAGNISFFHIVPFGPVATINSAVASGTIQLESPSSNLTVISSSSGGQTNLRGLLVRVASVVGNGIVVDASTLEEQGSDSAADLTTGLLAITADGGVGAAGTLELAVDQLDVATDEGAVDLRNIGNHALQILRAQAGTATDSPIKLVNVGASMTVDSLVSTATATLTTVTSGDILVNAVTADAATLTAAGNIQEAGADAGADIVAGTVVLTASNGIGTGPNPLEVSATTSLNGQLTGTGALHLASLNPLGAVTLATFDGDISLTGPGDLLVDNLDAGSKAVTVNSGGAISEGPDDPTADLTGGAVTLTAANSIGGGNALETASTTLSAQTTGTLAELNLAEVAGGTNVTLAKNNQGAMRISSANGNLDLSGQVQSFGDTLLQTTGSGDVLLGNTAVGSGRTLTVSSAGKIRESGSDAGADLTANIVVLTAVTGISEANPLETSTNTLSATVTGTGGISLKEIVSSVVVSDATTANGAIALTSQNGLLQVTHASTNGSADINLTTGTGDVRVGTVSAVGHAVTVNAAGLITEDTQDAGADLVGADVNLTAGTGIGNGQTLELQTGTLTGEVTGTGALLVSEVVNGMRVVNATTASGNVFISSPNGVLTVDNASAAGNLTLTTGSGADLKIGAVSATGKAMITASGSVYETTFDAATDVTAGGDSFIKALGGTLGTNVSNALEVAITAGTLSVLAGGQVGGVSARINGTVSPTNALIVLTPTPPGTVLFNGVQVFP